MPTGIVLLIGAMPKNVGGAYTVGYGTAQGNKVVTSGTGTGPRQSQYGTVGPQGLEKDAKVMP